MPAVTAIVWFVLIGPLWYVRPPDLVWLLASVVLGICFFAGFLWYVTRETGSSAERPVKGTALLALRDCGANE
jgi:hypothetical protein